ncbi:MAG: iron complex outermembrane recepter protein [bacterium]|nr:MAG: iron complex outermembrane recepter protein [bacterium]
MYKQIINLFFLLAVFIFPSLVYAQNGTIQGTVILQESNNPLHDVVVILGQLKRSTQTKDDGTYVFENIPPGNYTVIAHLDRFPDTSANITVKLGETSTLDLALSLVQEEQVTISGNGSEQSAFESIPTVDALNSTELAQKSQASLGEVLDNQPGVAKRSFGVGNSRPVIRGFDGDRVLVLNDGARSGSLASQSGDHGETVDVLAVDRIEVVKGPATLLYGGNAIGGVVNAISGHHDVHGSAHPGVRGYATGLGGSNNGQGGGSAGLEYGFGNFLIFGNGGSQRSGDYETPIGSIKNSKARVSDGSGGFGFYGTKTFFSFSYGYENGRYGNPFAARFEAEEEKGFNPNSFLAQQAFPFPRKVLVGDEAEPTIDIAFRRHNGRFNLGFRNLETGFIDSLQFSLNYSDYRHKELENNFPNTIFDNREVVYRGVFEQRNRGIFSGSFGLSGYHRNYDVVGAEALSPPVDVNNFAAFGLENLRTDHFQLQFGGRVDRIAYNPIGLPKRDFTGFSTAIGVRIPIKSTAAFVANYTSSYRAPALEELFNNGPHVGNLAFEIGDVNLKRERNDGVEFSLRYAGKKLRGEVNYFYYNIRNFVFLAPTGNIQDGLIEAQYLQANSRYTGTEAGVEYQVLPNLSINMGLDAVDAEIKATNSPLPRIPPLRGRIGLEARYKGFTLKPEVIMARAQNQIFSTETRTAGYTTVNLLGSYTLVQKHSVQIFSVNAFNLGDRLYRNHLSFIKDLAPEIGRGVKFSYTIRFF